MLKTIKGITSFFRIFRREGNRDGEKLLQKGDCMRMLTDLLLAAAMLGFMGITGYCFVRKMAELLGVQVMKSRLLIFRKWQPWESQISK